MLVNTFQLSLRCMRSNCFKTQTIKTLTKPQKYSDWAHRRPIAVVNEEIVLDDAEEAPRPRKHLGESGEYKPLKVRPRRGQKHTKKAEPIVRSDATFNEDGTLNIIKLPEDDKTLTSLMMTLKSRKMRERNSQILLEGHRLISDAIKAGVKPEVIICSRTPDMMKLPLPEKGVKLFKVPYKTIQLWSNLTTTPGIIGIFQTPESFEKESTKDTIPLTIICDNVREPGNLGSILRAAAGVGCERVIMTKGCVDVWEPKVLRSAAGAHFRTSISKSIDWETIKSMISPIAKIYAADNNVMVNLEDQSNTHISKDDLSTSSDDEDVPSLSMSKVDDFSSRTEEKTEELSKTDEKSEEFSKTDEKSEEFSKTDEKSADCSGTDEKSEEFSKTDEKSAECSGTDEKSEEFGKTDEKSEELSKTDEKSEEFSETDRQVDGKEKIASKMQKVSLAELASRIPVIPYYSADYTTNEVVLIVGGETEGLSYESIKLLHENQGVRVNVPLTNDVESLNTGMALGIVAFEVRRQFAIKKNALTE